MNNQRTISRDEWDCIKEKDIVIRDTVFFGSNAKASLLVMKKVDSPFYAGNNQVKICENGYAWLHIAVEAAYYWITAMYDETGKLFQIYIDITGGNATDCSNPHFQDMYIDFVIEKNCITELDKDELYTAYDNGEIQEEEFKRTLEESEKLKEFLDNNLCYFISEIDKEYVALKEIYM